ncbi:MAG: MFS transporter, partial [Actinomycetota bacterium]
MAARPRLVTPTFALVTTGAFFYFLGYGTTLPVLPVYVDGPLEGGDVAVGLVVGAFSLTAVVLRPLAGRLGDRRGRRILVVGGSSIVALAVLGTGLWHVIAAVVGLRLLAGAGESGFFTGAATIINDLAPDERRGEALSFFTVSLYLGLALGPLLGEWVLHGRGYDEVWLMSAALTVLPAMMFVRLPDTRPARAAASEPQGSRRFLHPAALPPGMIMTTSVIAFAGYSSFLPLYAREDLKLSGAAPIFLVYSLLILGVRVLGARIPDAFGARVVAPVSLSCAAAGLTVVAALPTVWGLYAGTALFALGQSLAFPTLM